MENKNIVGNITFGNNCKNDIFISETNKELNKISELNNRINELNNRNNYINRKYEALKKRLLNFKGTLEEVADNTYVPEANCSCHISPPCSDCVENGAIRENINEIRQFIKFIEITNRD